MIWLLQSYLQDAPCTAQAQIIIWILCKEHPEKKSFYKNYFFTNSYKFSFECVSIQLFTTANSNGFILQHYFVHKLLFHTQLMLKTLWRNFNCFCYKISQQYKNMSVITLRHVWLASYFLYYSVQWLCPTFMHIFKQKLQNNFILQNTTYQCLWLGLRYSVT